MLLDAKFNAIDENATVIFGTIVDESLKKKIITTVIATGVEDVE